MSPSPFKRFRYALQGLQAAYRTESSFRFQCIATVGIFTLAALYGASAQWWAIIALSCGNVLGLELLNTALERALNLLHPSWHRMIKISKDCAAGAVLVASFFALIVFGAFLFEYAL